MLSFRGLAVRYGGRKRVKLSILLYLLKLQLRFFAWRRPALRKMIAQRDYVLVIRTEDKRHARFFDFAGGKILSKRGVHAKPDVEMVWCDAGVAFRALAAGNDAAVMQAIGKSQLKIEGNLDDFFCFAGVTKKMMSKEA